MTRVNILALGLVVVMGNSAAFSPLGLHDPLQESFQAVPLLPSDSTFPVYNATRSFWMAGAPGVNPLAREGSSGPLTTNADVCIIGSGITGVSVAYHLSELLKKDNETRSDSLSVVILEARDFCELPFHLLNATYLVFLSGSGATGAVPPRILAPTAIDAHALCL
jgi:hypothetical protein